jgi:hypothetical protein
MNPARRRIAAVVAFGLMGGLLAAAPAGATVSSSTITSPADGAGVLVDADTGASNLFVKGTTPGAAAGDKVDLRCYRDADQTVSSPLATGIPVGTGSFAANVSLTGVPALTCRLQAVPAGLTPKGGAAKMFAGPVIVISNRASSWSTTNGNLWDFYVFSGSTSASFDFHSLGYCPIIDSFLTDPSTAHSNVLFWCNPALGPDNAILPDPSTRPGLQVDGRNAYLPGNVFDPNTKHVSALNDEKGFHPLTYSPAFDLGQGAVTITETDFAMACDAPDGYPPTPSMCPSLHDAGVRIDQTTALQPGGQVVRVTQRLSSSDGNPHLVDLLFKQQLRAPTSGASPGIEFPGQASSASHAKPDSFMAFPPAPSSIFAIADQAGTPSLSNPVGAITYKRPPTSADFNSPTGDQTASFLMHYKDNVPASGSVVYDWSFSQAANTTALGQLELRERDRMQAPTVTIEHPPDRAIARNSRILVAGRATDNVGVASLTVAGIPVTVGPSGSFSVLVKLRPGPNKITATATDAAGNTTSGTVSVGFRVPPCKVPKLKGKTLAAAKLALTSAHCAAGRVTNKRSASVRRGRVLAQGLKAGTTHRTGTRVSLVISRGR